MGLNPKESQALAVADLRKVMKLNRHNSLLKTGHMAESLAEHRAIMAAPGAGCTAHAGTYAGAFC